MRKLRSDAGKKRKSYDMTLRNAQKLVGDLAKTLEGLRKRSKEGTCCSERRRRARTAMLPKDRICPLCGVLKINSRQWVAQKHDHYTVICKSCYMRGK